MKNISKICILFLIFILFFYSSINTFAVDINMDNIDSTQSEISTQEEQSSNSNLPTVITTSSNDDEFLTIENILSIVIIVIGIILIFLAIAILIRCK